MRRHVTYANVMSTVAAFLAMGGGVVYAAGKIGSEQIAPKAVTTPKLDRETVTRNKIAKNAVTKTRIASDSVTRNKIAENAVTKGRIASDSVTSKEVEDHSIAPVDLEFPTHVVASPTGGSMLIPEGGPTAYPLTGNSWVQQPGALNVIFGSIFGTLAYDGGAAGSCSVNVSIEQDGNQIGGGFLGTSSTDPVEVAGSASAAPGADPDYPTPRKVSVELFANGCTADSTIDRMKFRVLSFGG